MFDSNNINISVGNLFRPFIKDMKPYSSARSEFSGEGELFLDANENPYDLAYNRYPDPLQKELKSKISDWKGVEKKSIFLGNGSDEVIDLLIRLFCEPGQDRMLCMDPSYGMYQVSANINQVPLDRIPLNHNFKLTLSTAKSYLKNEHKLIWLCSPNNPDGSVLSDEIIQFFLNESNGIVIIDEAYIDFSNRKSWISELKNYPNLIVLQTFSKSLGAAGIRMGMGFMNPDIVAGLNKIKPPYNISTVTQDAAIVRMNRLFEIDEMINRIKASREELKLFLESLPFVRKVFPSQANFLLVKIENSRMVYEYLLKKGIVVRDRSNQKGCEECLRITIGTETEIKLLKEALVSFNNNQKESR